MRHQHARDHFHKGLTALRNNHLYLALNCFEQAAALETWTECDSCLAYCRAAVRGGVEEATEIVRQGLASEPENALHYLLLGRLQLLAGNRVEALDTIRRGTHFDKNGELTKELDRLGTRKPPVFSSLHRSNPLNRIAGIILTRLGLRHPQQGGG
jgi:tetratricopeptide (TPR) repeat protein